VKKYTSFAIKEDKRPLISEFPTIIKDLSPEELADVVSKAKVDFNAQVNLEDIHVALEVVDGKKKKRKASRKTPKESKGSTSAPAKKKKKA